MMYPGAVSPRRVYLIAAEKALEAKVARIARGKPRYISQKFLLRPTQKP